MEQTKIEQQKREFAALRKYAAIQQSVEDKIGVQKIYVDITADIEAAFVLDEIIFFTLPRPGTRSGLRVRKNGILWLAVSRREWWDRKRLTARQADRAIDKLIAKNLIHKELHRFNGQATTHLRLNVSEFFKLYAVALEKSNPPEDESDTILKDISDLYAMMGEPEKVSPNGDTPLPNGDTVSPNGESNNNPHTSSTQPIQQEEEANPKTQNLFMLYTQEIGLLTPLIADGIEAWEKDVPEKWIQDAISEAAKSNARNWKYVEAILKRWKAQGNQESAKKPGRTNGKSPAPSTGDGWLAQKERELANGRT